MDSELNRGKHLANMTLYKGDLVKCVQSAFHLPGDICEVGWDVMADSHRGLWVHAKDDIDFEQGKVKTVDPVLNDKCPDCSASVAEYHQPFCPRANYKANPPKYPPGPIQVIDDVPQVKSDGGSSSYYLLPEWATELRHVISFKGMSFARGNIFKACYRLGEKDGTDIKYDINKMRLFLYDLEEMYERGEKV
jgi:hypothetical protein